MRAVIAGFGAIVGIELAAWGSDCDVIVDSEGRYVWTWPNQDGPPDDLPYYLSAELAVEPSDGGTFHVVDYLDEHPVFRMARR